MFKPVKAIEVRVWGQTAGAVAFDPGVGAYAFEFDPDFVRSGIDLAPIEMPLARATEPFIFPELSESTYRRLPGLLADSLPDDFGNALIDAWMAREGIDREQITALDRLAYMGKRGLGALEYRPARGPGLSRPSGTAIELAKLVENARRVVHGAVGTDELAEAALAQIIRVGTSAGGARAKAVIGWNPQTDEIRAGQFDLDEGFEHWILKFDGMGPDATLTGGGEYGRIEFAYHLMAREAGIVKSPCRLLEENGRAHFMTKRFDRDGNAKLHLQTLCAIAHLGFRQKATHDASQLFLTAGRLGLGYEALEEAFRRVAFNQMAANCDDHTKNWSFLLREGGPWELAPAYDVTHAYNPTGDWTHQHLLGVNGKFDGVTREDLLEIADRFGIGTAPRVLDKTAAAVSAWPGHANRAGLSAAEIERVRAHHRIL